MKYSGTISALAAASTLVHSKPIEQRAPPASRFTVPQVATGKTVTRNGPAALAKALAKYNQTVPPSVRSAVTSFQGTVAANPSDNDEQYTSPVTIGTPGQTVQLDFDTGSADLWVFSTETKGQSTGNRELYNPTNSSSANLQRGSSWKISYGDGSGASGTVYTDSVKIGSVTADAQSVEVATTISPGAGGQGFSGTDGLLGLAASSINTVSPRQAKTWFDTVAPQLDERLFTATLKHQQPGSYDFGFIDSTKHTGPILYAPVDFTQGFWQFTTDTFTIGTNTSSTSPLGPSIADTGTTLFLSDSPALLEAYYTAIPSATNSPKYGGWVFNCDAELPDLTLGIGGGEVVVPGSLVNFASNGDGSCFGGLQSTGGGLGFSILGDVFLKAVFAVFDQGGERVGFAPQAGGGRAGGGGGGGGNGGGDGEGDGSGDGEGSGDGDGNGDGNGNGNGEGSGDGEGNGEGEDDGDWWQQ